MCVCVCVCVYVCVARSRGSGRGDEQLRSQLGQSPLLLEGLLHLLGHGTDAARYWCCQCIVSLSHKHTQNQSTMAKYPGMMEAILEVLLHGSRLSRGAACSALVESTFRNAENALLVAKTPGLMHGVVSVMQNSVGDVRDDAAGVLRNCSNYSQEAAEVIVQTEGVLDALIEMCKGQHNSDRFTAMGTIQNLTRCESVAPLLCKTRVVTDALIPALHSVGTGEEHDVMRAEALMAITNLATGEELKSLVALPDIAEVIVQMLRCAVRGQAWKDVAWYDAEECLRPLAQMTVNPDNHTVLRSAGLVHVLVDLLCFWIEEQAFTLPTALHAEARYVLASVDARARAARRPSCDVEEGNSLPPSDAAVAASRHCSERDHVIDSCIGIGHERLRHAVAVWEVAASRPAHVEAEIDGSASSMAPGRLHFDSDVSDRTTSWCTGERRQPNHEVRRGGTHEKRGWKTEGQGVRDRRGQGLEAVRVERQAGGQAGGGAGGKAKGQADTGADGRTEGQNRRCRCGRENGAVRKRADAAMARSANNKHTEQVPREVDMACMALVRMAGTEACARTMRRLGLADVLRAVALAADNKEPAPIMQPWAQLSVMHSRHLAGKVCASVRDRRMPGVHAYFVAVGCDDELRASAFYTCEWALCVRLRVMRGRLPLRRSDTAALRRGSAESDLERNDGAPADLHSQ